MAERESRVVVRALLFCLGLLVLIPACLIVWGYVLPYYAQFLGSVTVPFLRNLFGVPIDSVKAVPEGLFNTHTQLWYAIGGRTPKLDAGALVFNVPPFVALMAITPGLRWRRRLTALLIGLGVLVAGHVVYILLAFTNASRIAHSPEIPTALGELFLTLPFLLWIVLGYWDKLTAFIGGPAPAPVVGNGSTQTRTD